MSMARGSGWDPSLMPQGISGGRVNVETSLIKPPVEGADAETTRLKRREVRERRGEERKEKEGRASEGKREGRGKRRQRRQRRQRVEGTGKAGPTVPPAMEEGDRPEGSTGRWKSTGGWLMGTTGSPG